MDRERCAFRMSNLPNKSFVFRVVLIYAVVASFAVLLVELIGPLLVFPKTVQQITRAFALLNGLFLCYVLWVITAASPDDRKLMFLRISWQWGPLLLGIESYVLVVQGFLALFFGEPMKSGLSIVLPGIVLIIWGQISAPFGRAWAFKRARNLEAFTIAEQRFNWPLKPEEVNATDIHISPTLYYTFIAGAAAIVFIVIETMISEFLGNTLGSAGYLGASIIALAAGAALYPAHKRMSKYITFADEFRKIIGPSDVKSVVSEFRSALANMLNTLMRYWYVLLLGFFVIWISTKWIVRISAP